MTSLRKSVAIGLAASILAMVVASPFDGLAATTSMTSRTLSRGAASVLRCDTNGLTVTYVLTANNVTSVTVGDVDAACATGTLALTLRSGAATSTGSGAIPAGGGSITVTISPAMAMGQSMTTFVTISGP